MKTIIAGLVPLILLASPCSSESTVETDQSAAPIRREGIWVTNDDYPAAQIRVKARGAVRYALTIDQTGKIYRCDIALSSGVSELDDLACSLMLRRGRFTPAKDRSGKPIMSEVSMALVWNLPSEVPKFNRLSQFDAVIELEKLPADKPYLELTVREIIRADGTQESCVLEEPSLIAALDRQACSIAASAAAIAPLKGPDGAAIRGMRIRRIAFLEQSSKAKRQKPS